MENVAGQVIPGRIAGASLAGLSLAHHHGLHRRLGLAAAVLPWGLGIAASTIKEL